MSREDEPLPDKELDAPEPAPDLDPLDRAKQAIRAGRIARGLDPDAEDTPVPVIDRSNPLARAQAALEKAAAAREATHGRAREREEAAKEQLAQLKAARGTDPAPAPGDGAPAPEAPKPRQRRL